MWTCVLATMRELFKYINPAYRSSPLFFFSNESLTHHSAGLNPALSVTSVPKAVTQLNEPESETPELPRQTSCLQTTVTADRVPTQCRVWCAKPHAKR